eukprot:g5924.t1
MDVKTWLTKIRPGLAAYEGIFRAQDLEDTDDIFLMKPENITDILSKCDAQGITAGLRNRLEHALQQKLVFKDDDGDGGDSGVEESKGGGAAGGGSAAAQREERNLFFIFTWLLLDPKALPLRARRAFRERWDAKYADDIGKAPHIIGTAWDDMAPATRGKLCWEGDETIVRQLPGQGVVKMKPPKPGKAALADPKVALNADLTTEIRPGDKMRIGPEDWCAIIGMSKQRQKQLRKQPPEGPAFGADPKDPIYWNKNQSKGSLMLNGPAGLPPAAGTFDLFEQVIKAESTTRIAANMVDPFKKHVSAGDDDKWDYSLLTFLLTYSAHKLVPEGSAAWDAVASLRDLRNLFFGHASDCLMTRGQLTTACGRMQTFVRELLDPAAEAEFKKLVDSVVSEHQFSTTAGGPGGPAHLAEGALRSWGLTLGVQLDDLGGDIKAMAKRLEDHDQAMQRGFEDAEDAAQTRHADLIEMQRAWRRQEERLRASHPLRDHIIAKIKEKRINFMGREWLFRLVREWLDDPTKPRTLVLTGDAGVGKSAFLAEVVDNKQRGFDGVVAATHFCDAQVDDSLEPKKFVQGLLISLAATLPGFAEAIVAANEGRETVGEVVQQMEGPRVGIAQIMEAMSEEYMPGAAVAAVAAAADGKIWLVCVDSMDEAQLFRSGGGSNNGSDIVSLLAASFSGAVGVGWPSWLRFLVTSRPEDRVVSKLEGGDPDSLRVSAMDERNVDDLRRYVQLRLLDQMALDRSQYGSYVEALCDRSQGVFLYARLVLDDLCDGLAGQAKRFSGCSPQELEGRLPRGLKLLYRERFERQFGGVNLDHYRRDVLPVMAVLVAARESLPLELLRRVTKLDEFVFDQVMQEVVAFCVETSPGCYRFVHQTFVEFIQDRRLAFGVRRGDHAGLADAALAEDV